MSTGDPMNVVGPPGHFRVVPDAKNSITPFLPVGVVKRSGNAKLISLNHLRDFNLAFPELLPHPVVSNPLAQVDDHRHFPLMR